MKTARLSDAVGSHVRIVVYGNYINKRNKHNQVSLLEVVLFGKAVEVRRDACLTGHNEWLTLSHRDRKRSNWRVCTARHTLCHRRRRPFRMPAHALRESHP